MGRNSSTGVAIVGMACRFPGAADHATFWQNLCEGVESITALNNGLKDFAGTVLFASHDMQFVDTIANRIIELTPNGIIDKRMTYEEYLADENIKALRQKMYGEKVLA